MVNPYDVSRIIERFSGVIPLNPAWVARDWIKSGRRLGLSEVEYDVGERGEICERWLASTTPAANRVTYDGEGISTISIDGDRIRLDEFVQANPAAVMGEEYASQYAGLNRLAKIFDYQERVPYHIHPPADAAEKAGLNSKDEAYYYLPGVDLGRHPESFFGVHSTLSPEEAERDLVRHLEEWEGTNVLALSKAYHQFLEGGYFVPSGILHSPGTALTLELQEDSDAMAFLQAECGGKHLSKDLLVGPLDKQEVAERGESAVLDWIDWDLNLVEDFHSRWHIRPLETTKEDGVEISWILYGSEKFCAKRYRLEPGAISSIKEPGAYSIFVWTGALEVNGRRFKGGEPGSDEALITYEKAQSGVTYTAGDEAVEFYAIFGPGLQETAPIINS